MAHAQPGAGFVDEKGALLMLSMPPPTTVAALPARIKSVASMVAFIPEPQTLLIVVAPRLSGSSAWRIACRAGACLSPALTTLPMITSSISAASTPATQRRGDGVSAKFRCFSGSPMRPDYLVYALRQQYKPLNSQLLSRCLADYHGKDLIGQATMRRYVPLIACVDASARQSAESAHAARSKISHLVGYAKYYSSR